MPIFRRTRLCYCMWCAALVLLDVVGSGCGALRCGCEQCWMWLVVVVGRCVVGCEHCEDYCSTSQCSHPTTATNHILQYQRSTPHAVTYVLFS